MILVDAHEDLAWSMHTCGRDYTRSAAETRQCEVGGTAPEYNGDTLLGWPDYQRGSVAVIFATLFAAPLPTQVDTWDTQSYADMNQAHRLYSDQLDTYHRLAGDHPDKFRLVLSQDDLGKVLAPWKRDEKLPTPTGGHPVGLVILMEGAEGVRHPNELEEWWQRGVRIIGPAWMGNRFCGGTRQPGPLTAEGFVLLEAMSSIGFTLDLSHMDEKAALQAVETYPGMVVATHSNALALLKGSDSNRHLSDRLIQGIIARDGVIGVVLYNAFLRAGWKTGDKRETVNLQHVVAHIDYICQMAGNARHAGLGTDFDGGFGLQSTPVGIDTIADLHKLAPLLSEKGYSDEDIISIFGENWLTRLWRSLPKSL